MIKQRAVFTVLFFALTACESADPLGANEQSSAGAHSMEGAHDGGGQRSEERAGGARDGVDIMATLSAGLSLDMAAGMDLSGGKGPEQAIMPGDSAQTDGGSTASAPPTSGQEARDDREAIGAGQANVMQSDSGDVAGTVQQATPAGEAGMSTAGAPSFGGSVGDPADGPLNASGGLAFNMPSAGAESQMMGGSHGAGGARHNIAGHDDASPPIGGDLSALECAVNMPVVRVDLTDEPFVFEDQTMENIGQVSGSCGGGSGHTVYRLISQRSGQFLIQLQALQPDPLNFMTVYIREACSDRLSEVQCVNRRDGQVTLAIALVRGRPTYLFIDGALSGGFASVGAYRLTISPVTQPQVTNVAAVFNSANGALAVDVQARPGSSALRGAKIGLLDEAGLVLNDDEAQERLLPFVNGMNDTMVGEIAFTPTMDAERRRRVRRIRVRAVDNSGVLSNPFVVNADAPRALMARDVCDVENVRSVCPDGTECFIGDPIVDPLPRCRIVGDACPDMWTVTNLNDFDANGRWAYSGNLSRFNPPLEEHGRGTCAVEATGENDLFAFTAPAAGRYRFETTGNDGDTIIWVRTQCGVAGAGAELGCNDDTVGLFSRVEGQIEQGQTVYVFVDSRGLGGRFRYTLTVSRQ